MSPSRNAKIAQIIPIIRGEPPLKMANQQTKKVRQTTVEEYEAPIPEEKAETTVIVEPPSGKIIEISQETIGSGDELNIDLDAELKQAILEGDIKLCKLILNELCSSPVEQAVTFLQMMPESQQATVIIERLADTMNQRGVFFTPCDVPLKLPNYTWYAQTADESDLYNRVVNEHGGGNYRFEIRYNKGFTGLSWKETLADSPEWILRHQTAENESEVEKLKRELEQIKADGANSNQNDNSNMQMLQLQVQLEQIKSENALAIAEMKHEAEIARIKADKVQPAETPLGLLQTAASSNNVELLKVAKGLLDNRGWVDFALDTLDNPDRMDTITNTGIKIGSAVLSFIFPGQVPPSGTRATTSAPTGKTESKKSLAEQYQERQRAKQMENADADKYVMDVEKPKEKPKNKGQKTKGQIINGLGRIK